MLPAAPLVERLRAASLRVSTVESCTGGSIAAAITDVAGSSLVFDVGFVTYSNAAKTDLVGVPPALIEAFGAVSEEVARAMAEGGHLRSGADATVAVTGIAGPDGGSPEKPVGLVHFALASSEGTRHEVRRFGNIGRDGVRAGTVVLALEMLEAWAAQRAATADASVP